MKRFIKGISLFALYLLFSSCLIKGGLPKNPCQSEEFLREISEHSRSELVKLARILESSTYGSATNMGCRAAILGKVYFELERMTESSQYFSEAAKKLPDLKEYFLLAKANALLKSHRYDDALKIANSLLDANSSSLTPQFALRTRRILADIAVQKKDNQQIINTHQDLIAKGYSEDEALLFNLAAALTNAGEHKKANDVYKRLLINFPMSEGAVRAQQLRNLAQYNLELKDIEKRFDKLIENLAFDQVISDVDSLLKKDSAYNDDAKGQINSLAVKSLMMNNKFTMGINRGRRHAMRKNATSKELEAYAWGLAKIGRFIDAAEYYEKFLKSAKDSEDKAKGCFFRGFSLYEASLYSMALFAWQGCHASIKTSPNYYEGYLWYQALASLLNGNHNKALSLLAELKKKFPKSADTEKYTFFTGYSLLQMNKKDGIRLFENLSKNDRPSYYVLLARQSLGLRNPIGMDISPDALSSLAQKIKNTDCKNAMLLFHLGFKDEARDLVLRATGATLGDKLAILQHIGFYHDAWQRSYLLNPKPTVINDTLSATPSIRASFPLPHQSIITAASRKYAVSRSLLYAIIRAESAFSESALSPRGALGLMQMMPFVAEDLASRLDIDEWNKEHLKNPKIAVELGALFLATLQRQFGNPHLMVAAYNAGPHQVQKWLNRFGNLPVELFVERIPFKQTRDYIKKVLESESLYYAMNGQELRLKL